MTYKIRITAAAKEDAKEYARFILIEGQSAPSASRWLKNLEAEIQTLSRQPTRCPAITEADQLGISLRCLLFYSHRVIFGVDDGESTVTIYRIYHGARRPLKPQDIEGP